MSICNIKVNCLDRMISLVRGLLTRKYATMGAVKKIAVIGGGASGICAAKHSLQHGYQVTVFEQTSNIGGLWVYTDKTGIDDNGLPVHTAMYKNLM